MKQILYKGFSKLALFVVLLAGAGVIAELEAENEPEVWAAKSAPAHHFVTSTCAEWTVDSPAPRPCGPSNDTIQN